MFPHPVPGVDDGLAAVPGGQLGVRQGRGGESRQDAIPTTPTAAGANPGPAGDPTAQITISAIGAESSVPPEKEQLP